MHRVDFSFISTAHQYRVERSLFLVCVFFNAETHTTCKALVVFRHARVLLVCTAKVGNEGGAWFLRFARHVSNPGIYTEDPDCCVWGGT